MHTAALAGASSVAMPYWLRAEDAELPNGGVHETRDTATLIRLIDETPREDCPRVLAEQIKAGVPYRELLAAAFLFAAQRTGHHTVYLVHGSHQLTLDAAPEDRLLPLFWAVDNMKEALARARAKPVGPLTGPLPSPSQSLGDFTAGMEAMDGEKSERAIVSYARAVGPKRAYAELLRYACRDNYFIGHIPIGIVTAGRALDVIGWHHAEETLRYIVRDMYRTPHNLDGQPYVHNVERVAETFDALPVDWAGRKSDPTLVRELVDQIKRVKKWWRTNDWIAEQLASGAMQAGTVWDACFLLTSELMIRHKMGGRRIGNLALHSNTTSNALRYAFDTLQDPKDRYLTMLQAVSWNMESMISEENRGFLRERSIFDFEAQNLAADDEDVSAEIFASLPPRIVYTENLDRTGQDHAAALSFSLAHRSPGNQAFNAAARKILCRKLTINAHDMKYPMAMFEELNHVSPRYRPHLYASMVHFMQSSTSVDCPAVVAGIEALQTS